MAHVYEGNPDGRQADTAIAVSRFRPKYRALTEDEKALHDALKDKAAELEGLFNQVKDGRYKSLAFTSLEQSVMWIVKELTS
ncbi:Acb2/Tad1 domain-containing protein [Bradyrhizobium sp. USDA 4452]